MALKNKAAASSKAPAPHSNPTSNDAPPGPSKTSTGHSILGGMAGGHRIDPSDPSNPTDRPLDNFTIPFKDKAIVCQRYLAPSTLDAASEAQSLIFTHGAGGGIANPATASFAAGFARWAAVLVVQGTMNLTSRVRTFAAVRQHEGWARVLGGRSMGARAAVMSCNEGGDEGGGTGALVLVSYPLDNGKGEIRDGILKEVKVGVDVLFVVGGGDAMCDVGMLGMVRREMRAKSWVVLVQGADHGMSLGKGAATEEVRKASGEVAARWVRERDEERTWCEMSWDRDQEAVIVGDWKQEPSRPGKHTSTMSAKRTETGSQDGQQRSEKRRRKQ